MTKRAKRMGRPSLFTQAIAAEICERLISGESLRTICDDENMPGKTTVLVWAHEREDFRDQYARARELSGESDADDVSHFARQVARGELDPSAGNVAINGLKWSAGKRQPKRYGDKLDIEHKGGVTIVAQDLDEQL